MTALEELIAIMEEHPEIIDQVYDLLLEFKGPQVLALINEGEAV